MKHLGIDTKKGPGRGIYSIIAREEGVHRSTVRESIEEYGNTRRIKRWLEIYNERLRVRKEWKRVAGRKQ